MDRPALILSIAIALGSLSGIALAAEPEPAPEEAPPPAPAVTEDSAGGSAAAAAAFASDEDRLDGDHLKLGANIYDFETIDGPDKGRLKCAPKGSKVVVVTQVDDYVIARVKLSKTALAAKSDAAMKNAAAANAAASTARAEAAKATQQANDAAARLKANASPRDVAAATTAAAAAANAAIRAADAARANAAAAVPATDKAGTAPQEPGMFATEEAASLSAISACLSVGMVDDFTAYKVTVAKLKEHPYRRTGVLFGALVVPFKFHLGGENKLTASSTIAPYVGFRGPAPFGLTFAPVVSAGLGLVPVNNPETDETDTKSAFSVAIGLLLTHSKNDKFNAGILFGKDFLSKSDRAGDDTVDEPWFSIYAGYKL
jgi:hypothetical protein